MDRLAAFSEFRLDTSVGSTCCKTASLRRYLCLGGVPRADWTRKNALTFSFQAQASRLEARCPSHSLSTSHYRSRRNQRLYERHQSRKGWSSLFHASAVLRNELTIGVSFSTRHAFVPSYRTLGDFKPADSLHIEDVARDTIGRLLARSNILSLRSPRLQDQPPHFPICALFLL